MNSHLKIVFFDLNFRFASDHRELHSSVSKVGKAIDRSFVADYDSTSREEVFASPQAQTMVNEIILQVKNEQETILSFIKQKITFPRCTPNKKSRREFIFIPL